MVDYALMDNEELQMQLYTFGGERNTPTPKIELTENNLTFQKGEWMYKDALGADSKMMDLNQSMTTAENDGQGGKVTDFTNSFNETTLLILTTPLKVHALTQPQQARLEVLLRNTLSVIQRENRLEQIYMSESQQYKHFWKQMIDKLYSEVFMSLALPRSLIMQCFIVDDVYPSGLRETIDHLIADRELIERDHQPKVTKEGSKVSLEGCRSFFSFFSSSKSTKVEEAQKEDSFLVNRGYLDYFVGELLTWADSLRYMQVLPYATFEAQIMSALHDQYDQYSAVKTLKFLKKHLKQNGWYSSHLESLSNTKIVKLSRHHSAVRPCRINKVDLAFFTLRVI